jgi:hypothetical protein
VAPGEEVGTRAREQAMEDDEELVVDRGGQDQVEPGRGVGELRAGVGEERRAEPHVRVPERERPLGDRAHEDLDVGVPVGVDVPLVEDTAREEGFGEGGGDRDREPRGRPSSRAREEWGFAIQAGRGVASRTASRTGDGTAPLRPVQPRGAERPGGVRRLRGGDPGGTKGGSLSSPCPAPWH